MKGQQGFTLIEVLVVTAILGVITAIGIPQFMQYRVRGFDARAKIDLHNIATAEEAYYVDYERYVNCDESNCDALLPAIKGVPSKGVRIAMTTGSATATNFVGTSQHSSSPHTFTWDSAQGGLVAPD